MDELLRWAGGMAVVAFWEADSLCGATGAGATAIAVGCSGWCCCCLCLAPKAHEARSGTRRSAAKRRVIMVCLGVLCWRVCLCGKKSNG